MTRMVISIIVVTSFLLNSGIASAAKDADLIPPEVLKQMDPDIRSGKRPIFATINQGDIFGLRDNPRFEADFVQFNFAVTDISTVQQRIIENWIRAGHNTVYLSHTDIYKYAPLLSTVSFTAQSHYSSRSSSSGGFVNSTLLRHPVNTDCEKVQFSRSYLKSRPSRNDSSYTWSICCFTNLAEEGSVIAEAGGGNAVCGSFPLGEGRIIFQSSVSGTDSRRWQLNYWHWVMGLGVPGAANTEILGSGSSGLTLKEAVKHDAMTLKNGDAVTGTIENEEFTVNASYGDMVFETDKIAKIVFEGAGNNVDVIRLKVGDKISGVIQDGKIKIKLVSGEAVEIDKDKVKEIQIRRSKAKNEEN